VSGLATPWGVRLERIGAAIVVTPSGQLDASSAGRLRDIIRSREDSFELLVLDLRDIVTLDEDGMTFLREEADRATGDRHRLTIVAGDVALQALARAGLKGRVETVDSPDEALAPHRLRPRNRG